ncbi:MAG: hypothetical protein GC160_26795 [Acidobacteria bacterium]|nr:hypothetical protein [Acidobacteriota bacterium]
MDQPHVDQSNQPPVAGEPSGPPEEFHNLEEQNRQRSFKEIMRQPVSVAVLSLTLGVAGLVGYLERGSFQADLQPPKVTYELLPNEGITEGVPIAIKLNEVAVFKIDDPMQGGAANRAKEVVAAIEEAINELVENPGRIVTLDVESAKLPSIVQKNIDETEQRMLIQVTEGDVKLSGQDDPKWVARMWAERVTDAFKLFIFGEAPRFTESTDFGEALTTMYLRAREQKRGVSKGSLEDAYESLTDMQKSSLLSFPPPEEPPPGTPGAKP